MPDKMMVELIEQNQVLLKEMTEIVAKNEQISILDNMELADYARDPNEKPKPAVEIATNAPEAPPAPATEEEKPEEEKKEEEEEKKEEVEEEKKEEVEEEKKEEEVEEEKKEEEEAE
jgi:hypothetical protein